MMNILNIRRSALGLVAVATFLPWITIGPFSVSLSQGSDGLIMTAVALVALALTFKNVKYLSTLATVGVGAFAVEEAIRLWHDTTTVPTSFFGSAGIGIGLILALVAGATAIGVIAYPYVQSYRSRNVVAVSSDNSTL